MTISEQAQKLRVVFAGTPEFAAAHLQALIQAGLNVVSAYSQPDRPFGRGKKLKPSPVKELAEAHGIPVMQPTDLCDPATFASLKDLNADVMIVVAYGLLLPQSVLSLPRFGCLNVHASLLSRWRGAAPIERAILAGDIQSGVCIMQMEKGLDTGPVLLNESTSILPIDTSGSLGERLQDIGCRLLVQAIEQLAVGDLVPQAQDESLACYASKIRKEEARIDWQAGAADIDRLIRAMFPRNPAYTIHNECRLRIIAATIGTMSTSADPGTVLQVGPAGVLVACGNNSTLTIKSIQPQGKGIMSIASLLNGHPDFFRIDQLLTFGPEDAKS